MWVHGILREIQVGIVGPSLADFATRNTANLFEKLHINSDFLQLPPGEWDQTPDYIEGRRCVSNIGVVNDTAERSVKLFEGVNKLITTDESEKQILLQMAEANRKLFPTETTQKMRLVLLRALHYSFAQLLLIILQATMNLR